MGVRVDLTGQSFGQLKVLKKNEDRKGYYICVCTCGNIKSIRGGHLNAGTTKSCGCLRENATHRSKTPEMINKRFGRLTVTAEYPERSKGKIQYLCDCACGKTGFVVSGVYLRNGDTQSCGCIKKEMDEQIRENLDKTAIEGTNTNILVPNRKLRADNTTGVTGVQLDKKSGLYRATIKFKGKTYDLGYRKKFDEAVKLRKAAEQVTHEAFLEWYEEYKVDIDNAPPPPDGSELETLMEKRKRI